MLLHEITTTALRKLDDEAEEVWSRAELDAAGRDGYDTFCRRTKCVFDIVVIENAHPTGGFGSDLQRYIAEHTPGMTIHDRRILFTQAAERDKIREPIEGGAVPITATVASQASGPVPGGRLPDGVVDVLRVTWDLQTLTQETAQSLRLADPMFETREGDPQAWLWGEDGLLSLRVWPAAAGDASYPTVDGVWGTLVYTDDPDVTVDLGGHGGYGFLSAIDGAFPSGGPHGIPNRIHPDAKNIRVEVARLGRDPAIYDLELPRVFRKYVVFWAMAQALKREGPGQDLELAQHYLDRFEFGVARMEARLKRLLPERRGQIGAGGAERREMLRVSLPAWWGYARPAR